MRLTLIAQAAHPSLFADTLPCLLTFAMQAAGEGHALVTVLSLPPRFTPKRERKWNIPELLINHQQCSTAHACIMSVWLVPFNVAPANWIISLKVKIKDNRNPFSLVNLAAIMFQSGPESSLKSFRPSLAGLTFNFSLVSHLNLWTQRCVIPQGRDATTI